MKNKLLLLILCISFVILSACSSYNRLNMELGFNSLVFSDNVSMEITDEWIDSGSPELNVKIKNNTSEELFYTEEPHVEVLLNGAWYIVPFIDDAVWPLTLYSLGANDTQEYVFSLSDYFELEGGYTYRLIKNFGEYFSYAEFFVEEI